MRRQLTRDIHFEVPKRHRDLLNSSEQEQEWTRRDGSNVVGITTGKDGNSRRQAHFASFLPLTSTSDRIPATSSFFYFSVSAWLASTHLDSSSNSTTAHIILPSVQERLKECDIEFSLGLHDSQYSAIKAARELANVMGGKLHSNQKQEELLYPVALIGAALSNVSIPLSTLSSAYDLPQISPYSTSDALDNRVLFPLFARTGA
jgi:hypothetical protein